MLGSEEPNLFLRKQNDSEEYDEKWDDSEIIAAYDKAVFAVKKKITRKIQRELGLQDEDVQEFLSDAGSSSSKSKRNGKGRKKKNKKRKWAVGGSCRAVYSEDGEEYEAVVVKIVDGHWGIVRFVGYENEEEVMLEDLTPSLGKSVIQAQIEAANNHGEEDINEEVEHQDEVPKAQVGRTISEESPRHNQGHTRTFEPTMRRFPMSFPIPPLPPAPPLMMTKNLMRRQDDVNSMLMSWYMCGYYTGLYERGEQLAKN